jgi:hypothetical protein
MVVSWGYFFHFWKKYYPHISIRRPTADICNDCYIFYNQVKFKSSGPTSPFIPVDSTDEECSDSSDSDSDNESNQQSSVPQLNWKTETTIQEGDSLESMIEKAYKHVEQAKNMRMLLSGKARLALSWSESIKDSVTITDNDYMNAIDTILGDYCQNLALPYLGEHQPGETYYFSPLTVNCFGIANVGLPKAMLTSYIYHEGEGKKGGNNVASLVHKYLDEQGWINRGRAARKELNIIMDNCGGQNKNKYVLQLAPLFVELKYYRRVNIIFLVAGHTKNAADRLFNLLKLTYRKSQVYNMDQLEEMLNRNQYVECIKVGKEDFKDYGSFEDSLYKTQPLSGHTKKYQLFYCTDENPTVLIGKEDNISTTEHRMDLKKNSEVERSQILNDFDVERMDKLNDVEGIRLIKQVELYTKWRKHVPDEYKSPLYDHPGEDVLQSVKDDRKNKKKYIKENRKRMAQVDAMGILAARKSPETKKRPRNTKTTRKATTATARMAPKMLAKKSKTEKPAAKRKNKKK